MTSLIAHQSTVHTTTSTGRPSRARRAVLVAVGVLNCALPVVFTLNITRMLLTGVLPDHRFHQATGQGEILFALWLLPVLALLHAGWHGRRPGTAVGFAHLVLAGSGVVCAAVAPGGGAPFLVGVIVAGGALLWAVLPQRPTLRREVRVDPVLAPIALAGSAVLLPYAVGQLAMQNAARSGFHSLNPHFFDQAWIAVTMSLLALLAALVPAVRSLAGWFASAMVVLGGAGLAFGESTPWSAGVLGLGLAAATALLVVRPRPTQN